MSSVGLLQLLRLRFRDGDYEVLVFWLVQRLHRHYECDLGIQTHSEVPDKLNQNHFEIHHRQLFPKTGPRPARKGQIAPLQTN